MIVAVESTGNSSRVLAVLDALIRAGYGDVGVRELADQLDMSRSAVHRILAALGESGYAAPLPSGRYRMTARLTAWGERLERTHRILAAARPVMTDLATSTRENVHTFLRIPMSTQGVYVATAPGNRPVSYRVELGRPSQLHVAAAGRACLAALDFREADKILAPLPSGERDDVAKALETVRRDGFAVTVGHLIPEASGVAAALYRDGTAIGSLTVSMPAYRLDDGLRAGHARGVMEAAAEVSRRLGH